MAPEDGFDDLGVESVDEEEHRTPLADSELSVGEFEHAHAEAIARERARFEQMDATAIAEEIAKAQAILEELGNRREDHARRMETLATTIMALEARTDDAEVNDLLAETGAELARACDLEIELNRAARRAVLHLRELHLLYGKHDVPQG